MKTNRKKTFFLLSGIFLLLPFSILAFSYTPMEKIPGYSGSNDFPQYLLGLYNFGIAAIGIAALLMIMLGGYMYIASAGNNSQMEKAKGVITDALIGVVMALTAWLILYEINPELTKVSIIQGTLPGGSSSGGNNGGGGSGNGGSSGGPGNGTCTPVATGDCSVESLQGTCLASNAQTFSAICNRESHGDPTIGSGVDKCKDGNSWSMGLFQINMFNSAESVSACSGGGIFTKSGGGSQGACLQRTSNGKACQMYDCQVVNQDKYNACKSALSNPQTNIQAACSLSKNGTNLRPWGGGC